MESTNAKSVEHLSELYTVVVGLALTIAMSSIFDIQERAVNFSPDALLGVGALVVTLIPFFHGGLRHLHDTYAKQSGVGAKLILWDFLFLFLEACAFLAAAVLVQQSRALGIAFGALWLIDIVWVFGGRALGIKPVSAWAYINIVAVLTIFAFLVLTPADVFGSPIAFVVMFLIATIRTITDYIASSKFYFPEGASGAGSQEG